MSSPNEKDYPPEIWKLLPDILKVMNENVDNSVRVYCQGSILENLKFNYPKIKFEYNENITKEFVLT